MGCFLWAKKDKLYCNGKNYAQCGLQSRIVKYQNILLTSKGGKLRQKKNKALQKS